MRMAKKSYFCAKILNAMKKVLPLLLFVLLVFSGCQRGPVVYDFTENPSEVATNAEKFVKQTAKRSSHYTAEDWQVAVEQFVAMSKNFIEKKGYMSQNDIDRFTAARLDFMKSVQTNGTEELALQIKEAYNKMQF